ncbi:protein of unknown function [Pustulibacterium marinum]|uniref:DUF4252 domain-containing protein n=1 Tax=Pustulibacterium marinum TaxID=1224947 RepID=A0A1I7H535_9FLAO|nr:DUF4252 domain-containing protein [Pustulibacterium marinum]SFU55781.1 protein of unknown function [Pustulibacterium marinum]
MITFVKYTVKLIFIIVMLLFTISCSVKGGDLQEYIVEKSQDPEFITFDVPTSIFDVSQTELTAEEKEIYNSIKKVNVLMLQQENSQKFKIEATRVSTILKSDDFEKLISLNDKSFKGQLYYIGDDENVDEVIIYGKSPDKGFAIIRILGDEMKLENIGKLMNILQKSNIDEGALGTLTDFFEK